jgi:hypothetical protein
MYYRARYYHPALGRFVSADTIVPEPGNPQSLNRYAYVLNNPLRYVDPSGHAVDPGGAAGGVAQKQLPWYAPIVIGAAEVWWWADANFGSFARRIEADRLILPLELSLSDVVIDSEGLSLQYDSAFLSLVTKVRLKSRVDWGNHDTIRIDQTKLTVNHGELSQIYTNWEGNEYGMTWKGQTRLANLGRGQEVGVKGKSVVGFGTNPPLNPYMVSETVGEIAYTGSFMSEELTVRLEPCITSKLTFHGGPAILVLVPVGVYYAFSYVIAAAAGSGTLISQPIPTY